MSHMPTTSQPKTLTEKPHHILRLATVVKTAILTISLVCYLTVTINVLRRVLYIVNDITEFPQIFIGQKPCSQIGEELAESRWAELLEVRKYEEPWHEPVHHRTDAGLE